MCEDGGHHLLVIACRARVLLNGINASAQRKASAFTSGTDGLPAVTARFADPARFASQGDFAASSSLTAACRRCHGEGIEIDTREHKHSVPEK